MTSVAMIVSELARGLQLADARRPVARSHRSGREYQPGIGPHAENAAIALALECLSVESGLQRWGQFVPYPGLPRQKCDLWIGQPHEWVIEVKMARLRGDNGKPDDTAIKDILSPYESDRSALTDCTKLAKADFTCAKGILIYGFDYPDRPLDPLIDAFELLACRRVYLGERAVAGITNLIHPVHSGGRVFGWTIGKYG